MTSAGRLSEDDGMTVQKAAGVIDAAYYVHERADNVRGALNAGKTRWSNAQVADLLDAIADDLKVVALVKRDEP